MKHARIDYDRIQDPAGLIPADEPVFLIRGQDKLAVATMIFYANLAKSMGVEDDLVGLVEQHIDAVEAWQQLIGSKMPDVPQDAGG